jgi:hypothetical protein
MLLYNNTERERVYKAMMNAVARLTHSLHSL